MDRESSINRLREILEDMVVPVMRRENLDLPWLARNLGIYNGAHPDYKEAINIIIGILRDNNAR